MFRNALKLERPNHPFAACAKTEMLLGLQAIDEVKKNKYCLTAAGLLLFGKELRILNQFPSYFIDFMVIPAKHGQDVQTRWVERYSSEQSIIQTYHISTTQVSHKHHTSLMSSGSARNSALSKRSWSTWG